MLRAGAPGDLRLDRVHVDLDLSVERSPRITWQGLPVDKSRLPQRILRHEASAGEILIRHVIRRNHAHLGAALDRHVADRQPPFDV